MESWEYSNNLRKEEEKLKTKKNNGTKRKIDLSPTITTIILNVNN